MKKFKKRILVFIAWALPFSLFAQKDTLSVTPSPYIYEAKLEILNPTLGFSFSRKVCNKLWIDLSLGYCWLKLGDYPSTTIPIGMGKLNTERGDGCRVNLASRFILTNGLSVFAGLSYRYFQTGNHWVEVDESMGLWASNSISTMLLMNETSSTIQGIVGLNYRLRQRDRFVFDFHAAMGYGPCYFTTVVTDETYGVNGTNSYGSNPKFPNPPFTKQSLTLHPYLNAGFSVGLRYHQPNKP